MLFRSKELLKTVFVTISPDAVVSVEKPGESWLVTDEENGQLFRLQTDDEGLGVYAAAEPEGMFVHASRGCHAG